MIKPFNKADDGEIGESPIFQSFSTCQGRHFRGCYFRGHYFQQSHFRGYYFRQSHFRGCYFRRSHFRGCYFRRSYFPNPCCSAWAQGRAREECGYSIWSSLKHCNSEFMEGMKKSLKLSWFGLLRKITSPPQKWGFARDFTSPFPSWAIPPSWNLLIFLSLELAKISLLFSSKRIFLINLWWLT